MHEAMKKTNSKALPLCGHIASDLFRMMADAKAEDVDWQHGKIWGLVYFAGEEHTEILSEAYKLFFNENGLAPAAFPSLKKFEAEVVSMVLSVLRGDEETVGTMTSGGTESILLAVKTYRDYFMALRPNLGIPEMVIPNTAHPAFFKAAHYFGLKSVPVLVGSDYRADLKAVESACSDNTIMIVASAPSYPQGVVDPVTKMGNLALDLGVGLHVDACLGGFMLPFLRELGHEVPDFDFSVPGVTSISADLHKYGYTAKGASAILYRNAKLRRKQFFFCKDWAGGLYASPTMLGTRSGGAIAAAWAALMALGKNGYLDFARQTIEGANRIMSGIEEIPGLEIVGRPDMSVFSFTSKTGNIFAMADCMEKKGWRLNRQTCPDSLHMIVTVNHLQAIEQFLEDLEVSVDEVLRGYLSGSKERHVMLYGRNSETPEAKDPMEFLIRCLEENYDV